MKLIVHIHRVQNVWRRPSPLRDGCVLEHMNSLVFVFKEANDTMLVGTLVECEADLTSVDAGCVARQRPGRGDTASTILAV
jgi:hypothetical protein